ncbi:MAG TPA: 2-oxoglutarate dehydrogenase E1 component [Tepidisphaeraceae bacterium]|nr:2-oxoglutarate dehydrogenase E1 component [Tepidisphaeraceae bacterium]
MKPFEIINQENADYVDRLHQQYISDPQSVEPIWQAFFAGFEAGGGRQGSASAAFGSAQPGAKPTDATAGVEVTNLVHSYRELGHFIANLDPLGHNRSSHPLLEMSQFGLTPEDLNKRVTQSDFLGQTDGTLRDLVEKLRQTYCGSIGVEFTNMPDKTQREWLMRRMEPIYNHPDFSVKASRELLYQLCAAQGFEDFLAMKYGNAKRFGVEGGESLIPLMNTLVDDGAQLGVENIVIGSAHRGRLNILAHVVNKPWPVIMGEFEGTVQMAVPGGDGDVKYHLGYAYDRELASGKKVHIALAFNPSHLELVDPVVCGIVRAQQNYMGDHGERRRVAPIMVHGDASFTGQGIVSETLNLSQLPYYRTGGTIHIIVNNQIGFTTLPRQGRFTTYPTDVAKTIEAPIFHVNGDDPEACVHAARLAIAFRQEFRKDVMIDLWCYRKRGHNEGDEPSFTQPVMYKEIARKTSVRDLYAAKLIEAGKITAAEFESMKTEANRRLEDSLSQAKQGKIKPRNAMSGSLWEGFTRNAADPSAVTKVSPEMIKTIADAAAKFPADFTPHPKVAALYKRRVEMANGRVPMDWGCAEMLALGSVVLEGTPVRFVGQDAQRGTFSHRHAALRDYNDGKRHVPLASIAEQQAPIIFVNTMLSELAVVGFEYGFSIADPRNLVVWEAQFGDFVNCAQPIIDQFIVAAESKWQKMSGMVLLLPHGYEGAGPEHSNAYLERFLASSAENNIQVVYPSLPSQYFHVLRRQMKRTFRKPLILFMPKSLLRSDSPAMGSWPDELTQGAFQLVIDDPANPPREKVRRLLLCSGKVYFALNAQRESRKLTDVAIVRVEQLYPYPQKELQAILAKYRNASEVVWVQEEPKNRGAWTFMSDRLEPMLPETTVLNYVGRAESASPATGSHKLHEEEERELIARALEFPHSAAEDHGLTMKSGEVKAVPASDALPTAK